MQKSDDDVGDLHAGVVDVVLHIDFAAGDAQQANKGIAQDRVAQVADVGGLVGIDAGVLDQNLAGRNFGLGRLSGEHRGSIRRGPRGH